MSAWQRAVARAVVVPGGMTALLLLSLYGGFLFYHSLAELFSIVVAYIAFVVAAYTYRYSRNDFLMFLGIVFFWSGSLDVIHTLTYKGVEVFHGLSANTPTQYWIGARLLAAVSFLVSPIFFFRRLPLLATFTGYGALAALIAYTIYYGYFPDAYIEGQGLTPFKVYSEYAIIVIMLATMALFIHLRHYIKPAVLWPMLAAIILTMLTEVVFTLYISLQGFTMVLGHALKFLAFWMVFIALVRTTLLEPVAVMSRASSTYDAIPDPTVMVDAAGRVQQANQATYKASGLGPKEVMGRPVHTLFHDDTIDASECVACQHIRQGRALERVEILHGDHWYKVSLAPVVAEGLAAAMVHVASDITARKRASERVEQSEEQFRQLAETIAEVFWVTDPAKQKMLYVSPAYEQIWGRSVEGLYREPLSFVAAIHAQDRAQVVKAVARQANGDYDEFYRVVRPDGSIRWVRDRAFPIRDAEGRVYRIVGLATDVTQQIEAEDAKRSSEAKSAFLSRMSHELRTPLTAVLGFSQLLQMNLDNLTPDQRDFIYEIEQAGEHLLALVDDMLDLTRIESGKLQVELGAVEVGEVLRECLAIVTPMAERGAIRLDYPLTASPLTVLADRTRLKQVLINLLSNGIKYNRAEGRVAVTTERLADGAVVIAVRDSGSGIAAQELETIFEPFIRLQTGGVDGLGIGLTLTRYLVNVMGGELGVESEPGVGSRFWVRLRPAA